MSDTQDNTAVTEATAAATKAKKAEPIPVTMDDGRVVEFSPKKKLIKTSLKNADGTLQVRLDWANGETRLFTLPTELLAEFALHGASQKLGDEISGVEKIDDCVNTVDELIERLKQGKWNEERAAGSGNGSSVLYKALCEFYDGRKTPEEVRSWMATLDAKTKLALRANPRVKVIVDRLEAEKAAKAGKSVIDTDALLDS